MTQIEITFSYDVRIYLKHTLIFYLRLLPNVNRGANLLKLINTEN